MKDQDKKQFALLMGEVGAAFGRNPEKEMMSVYFKHLADYSIEAVTWGVEKAIQTGDRFPVIKTLRDLANGYRPPQTRQPVTESVQIPEFTETQIKDAKEELANIMGSLSDGMTA